MDFQTKKIARGPKGSLISQAELISLYINAPQEEISLDEFELFALDRLSLLRAIEALKARGFQEEEFKVHMTKLESLHMPLKAKEAVDATGKTASQRKDQISHFILRLAYCRTEELRRWFLTQEFLLLKFRLEYLSTQDMGYFMASNGMNYDQVSMDEKKKHEKKLVGLSDVKEANVYSTVFYKIPFQEALSLVASRQVFLHGGFAFVPLSKLISVILIRFRINLSKSLSEAVHFFDYASADNRIGSLLKNMNKQYTGKDFSKAQSTEKLTVDNIDNAADNNMPLCMKNLHNHLKHDHKLKHWGRLQYGLFLKAAGMDLDDAQRFWEAMFCKIMSHDDFNKKYAYNVRHMYGKEGARKSYTPYSCMKIIMGAAPEVGGHHGCPYK
jgi:DNA primase large subunit